MFSTRVWNYLQIPWNPRDTISSLMAAKKSFNGPCFLDCDHLLLVYMESKEWVDFQEYQANF
jgi:hypothetical protein